MAEKILVVDDDLDTLRLVGMMLERQGYSILAASNGHQALVSARTDQPDLILLDLMMPDIDGIEVARQLRSNSETQNIPIIMFTAKTQLEDKLLGFDAGADDYLTKPTQPRELVAHVKAVLARSQKSRKAAMISLGEKGYLVGVLAARGGLGVSTLAMNLGISLYDQQKKDVIVADFRPGNGTMGLELGYLRAQGLNRLLDLDPVEITPQVIDSALVSHQSKVRFLFSSSQSKDARFVSSIAHFEAIALSLPHMARYVILDLGASLTPVNEKILPMCDEVLVVLEPVPHTITQTRALIDDLSEIGLGDSRVTPVLINRVRTGMQLTISQVQDQLKMDLAAVFSPAPEMAYQASIQSIPLVQQHPDSITAQQFEKLAERIIKRSGL